MSRLSATSREVADWLVEHYITRRRTSARAPYYRQNVIVADYRPQQDDDRAVVANQGWSVQAAGVTSD